MSPGVRTRSHFSFTVFCILSSGLSCFKTGTVENETRIQGVQDKPRSSGGINCSVEEVVEVNEHPKAQMFLVTLLTTRRAKSSLMT